MADKFEIKMPEFNPTLNITISGEDQLRNFVIAINSMMDGADYQDYYKPENTLLEDIQKFCKEYSAVSSSEKARILVNTYHAYLAKSNNVKNKISKLSDNDYTTILNAKSIVNENDCFSLDLFLTAFSTFKNLQDYGINLDRFFDLFSKLK